MLINVRKDGQSIVKYPIILGGAVSQKTYIQEAQKCLIEDKIATQNELESLKYVFEEESEETR